MKEDTVLDPDGLIRFETDIDPAHAAAPVLVVALSGFFDAGSAQGLLVRHLMEREHQVVATVDIDQLLDYRGRRPLMTFAADHWSAYDDPVLAVYRLRDDEGRPFLLLAGPEPDFQWERFVEAVRRLIAMLGVELVISAHGIPMAVPHTRPLGASFHANREERREGHRSIIGEVTVPGSVSGLLELRLGEQGADACGYAVHVPHYLAQSDYAPAAVTALNCVLSQTGLVIDGQALESAAQETLAVVAAELEGSPDAAELVSTLEEQYDNRTEEPSPAQALLDDDGRVPTADQLGAEFEAFLREETGRGQ
ncbi:hypothetical protein BJY21_004102 [Kineosphaera limosa]|uniref:PAC2 family protein n=1 Tax=Kineosphaera limosa TaxID=111564 RepID=UPI0017D787C5|nr:PAC2 family protein [Kineosphaera limosa]NYE02918.1 hypothetical protein [Kineosphaera limosa]